MTVALQPPTRRPPPPWPVVLVPGLGLGAKSWGPSVRALGEDGTVDPDRTSTALLPGYGRRARSGEVLTPAGLACRLLDQMAPGPSVVIALSAGCQVAAHAALRAPTGSLPWCWSDRRPTRGAARGDGWSCGGA